MIKAVSLRVGNLILGNTGVETVRMILGHEGYKDRKDVHEIYKHLIGVEENRNQYNLAEIKPISTTGEWLERFGFELIKSDNPSPSDWFWIKDNIALWNKTWIAHGAKKSLEHIHKLQNYYYENMDKELPKLLKIEHISYKK